MKPNNEKGGKKSMLKKSKRFLAGLLAFLLVVTMVPTDMLSVVYAEEESEAVETVEAEVSENADDDNEAVVDTVDADDDDETVVDTAKTDDDNDNEAAKADDDDALADSETEVDSDETEEEVLDVEDTDSDSEFSESNLDNKEEIENDNVKYTQGSWTASANDTQVRTTSWDFTSTAQADSQPIAVGNTLKGIKCLSGSVSYKKINNNKAQGLSVSADAAVGILLDKDTSSVTVKMELNSANDNRVAIIGENSVRVWQRDVGASKNTGLKDEVAVTDAQKDGDEVFNSTYEKTYSASDMTTDGESKYIKFHSLLGEWKINTIEITETKPAGASTTTPTAAFADDKEPALSVSKDSGTTCEELHPGDKLTVAYELDLADGKEDASEITWTRVKGDVETPLEADEDDPTSYTIVEDDIESTIKVTVTPKIDDYDNGEPASDTSDEVTALEDGFITDPYFEINGDEEETEANVGDTLTVKYETGHDETREATIAWYRVAAENAENLDIDGIAENESAEAIENATTKTYTLTDDDEDCFIVAVVSLGEGDDALTEGCQTQSAVAAWKLGFSVKPALTSDGDEEALYLGDTLTVSYTLNTEIADGITDTSDIKWYRCKEGSEDAAINEDASDPTKYTVTTNDIGYTIKVTVTPEITEGEGEDAKVTTGDPESAETENAVSEKVATFTTDPSFNISTGGDLAYPQPGDRLTVAYELDMAEDETDESVITWTRVNGETETPLTADTVEGDDLDKTYTIVTDDIGCTIKVSVTPKTNNENVSAGNPKTYTSNEVREVGYTPTTAYNMSLKGSDIPSGTYTSTVVKNGFTINAGSDAEETKKSVGVDANSKTINNTAYTARIKLSGQGAADYRSISFTAVKEATLEIACMASNDSTAAKLAIATANNGTLTEYTGDYELKFYNKDGNSVVTTVANAYSAGGIEIDNKLNNASDAGGSYITVTLPAGTYYLYTPDAEASAVNFYEIKVTYEGGQTHGDSEYYTVTFNKNGGINDIPSQKVLKDEKCLEPAGPVRDRYKFKGWYTDAEGTTAFDFGTALEGNLTLYAGWEEDPDYENLVLDMKDLPQGDYTTSFDYHGFTLVGASGKALSVASGSANVDGKDYTQVLKFGGTGDTSGRYIKFTTEKKATVTVVAIKGGSSGTRKLAISSSVNKDNPTYAEEMTSTSDAQKWVKEIDAGTWYVYSTNSGINVYYISVVEDDDEDGDSYTVEFKDNDGSALSSPIASATTTGTLNLSEVGTPSKDGYTFKGWTTTINGSSVDYTATQTITITSSTTLYAVWEEEGSKITYTITLMNGDTEFKKVTATEGIACDLMKDVPAETDGKVCVGWATTKDATEAEYTVIENPSGDLTLYAVWKDKKDVKYTVTYYRDNDKTVVLDTVQVAAGEEITLPEPDARDGYTFIGWNINGETKNAGDKYTVNGDTIIIGLWKTKEVPQTGMDIRVSDATYAGGVAVLPNNIKVYYKGTELTLGTDYTVKGKNNKNAGKATLTVTGIGNYKGLKREASYQVLQRNISTVEAPSKMTLIKDAKVNPVILYNGKQLKLGKDFKLTEGSNIDAKGKYTGTVTAAEELNEDQTVKTPAETRTMKVEGIGNYTGTSEIEIKVVDKASAKQLAVEIEKGWKPAFGDDIEWEYLFMDKMKKGENGEETVDQARKVKVYNKKDKTTPLEYGTDFVVVDVSGSIYEAGTYKFTVVGTGEYSGSVTKSIKVSPKKLEGVQAGIWGEDEKGEEVFKTSGLELKYNPAGATFENSEEGLEVRYSYKYTEDGAEKTDYNYLEEGYDYTISYSGNKKVGTAAKAKINFIGDYKGTKALVVPFTITGATLNYWVDDVYAADMTYAKAGKSYVSKPIVVAYSDYDGTETILKANEYQVSYEWSSASDVTEGKRNWTPDDKVKITLKDGDSYALVRATIKPSAKSNFVLEKDTQTIDGKETEVEVPLVVEYHVRKADTGALDLSKAKVEFYSDPACTKQLKAAQFCRAGLYTPAENKAENIGEHDDPDAAVYVKVLVNKAPVDASLYKVTWICNYDAGKATVIITGNGPSEAGNASSGAETQADGETVTTPPTNDGPATPSTAYAVGGKTVSVKINPLKTWIDPTPVTETVTNFLKEIF